MKKGIEIRKEILISSLYLESFLSHFLGKLLGIKDINNTISLGNSGKSLSFSSKLNLLIDIGAIKKNDQKKFIAFMEIRNQFMHNLNATTFELCVSFIDGKEKFLLNNYPQKSNLIKEKQLEGAISSLTNDVFKLTIDIFERIKDKSVKDAMPDLYKKQLDDLIKSIYYTSKQLDKHLESIQKDGTIQSTKIKGLGKEMLSVIISNQKKLNLEKKTQ